MHIVSFTIQQASYHMPPLCGVRLISYVLAYLAPTCDKLCLASVPLATAALNILLQSIEASACSNVDQVL